MAKKDAQMRCKQLRYRTEVSQFLPQPMLQQAMDWLA